MIPLLCFKQKTAYDVHISDWSSDVYSSDLHGSSATKQKPCHLCPNLLISVSYPLCRLTPPPKPQQYAQQQCDDARSGARKACTPCSPIEYRRCVLHCPHRFQEDRKSVV